MNESSLIAFCDGLSKEKISDKSEDEKSIMDEDMDIDMRCLSLEENLPKEEDINLFQSEENTNIGSNHDIEAEAQYSRETGPVDLGFGSIFWEVAKDFSFVIREVIGDIDNKDPSAENNNQSGRPISPDMFESEYEEEEEIKKSSANEPSVAQAQEEKQPTFYRLMEKTRTRKGWKRKKATSKSSPTKVIFFDIFTSAVLTVNFLSLFHLTHGRGSSFIYFIQT